MWASRTSRTGWVVPFFLDGEQGDTLGCTGLGVVGAGLADLRLKVGCGQGKSLNDNNCRGPCGVLCVSRGKVGPCLGCWGCWRPLVLFCQPPWCCTYSILCRSVMRGGFVSVRGTTASTSNSNCRHDCSGGDLHPSIHPSGVTLFSSPDIPEACIVG